MAAIADPCRLPAISAEQVGWRGDSIKAEAFAFLAARTLAGLPISFPGATGVAAPMSGGRVTPDPAFAANPDRQAERWSPHGRLRLGPNWQARGRRRALAGQLVFRSADSPIVSMH